MKKERLEDLIKNENQEGELWFLENSEQSYECIIKEINLFLRVCSKIMDGQDMTIKKSLMFSTVNYLNEICDYSNSYFKRILYDLEVGDSPIETLFYNVFEYVRQKDFKNKGEYYLVPQREIEIDSKTYRVDFELVNYLNDKKILIECDGYDFHSEKKQMKKDYERQRNLENAGYTVIRFLGTEIFNNPLQCVYDLYKRANLLEE